MADDPLERFCEALKQAIDGLCKEAPAWRVCCVALEAGTGRMFIVVRPEADDLGALLRGLASRVDTGEKLGETKSAEVAAAIIAAHGRKPS